MLVSWPLNVYWCLLLKAWSITYPSWLAFVFLITACLVWMIPKKRVICMRLSPLIVFYAECLLTITYVYGFDAKLPDHASGGYNLKDIGLIKYEYPVGPLAAQVSLNSQGKVKDDRVPKKLLRLIFIRICTQLNAKWDAYADTCSWHNIGADCSLFLKIGPGFRFRVSDFNQ